MTRNEERTSGADIGVVVDIGVPSRLQLRMGEFIQVKKSAALTPGRTGRTRREDTWTIKRRQLHDLLEHSASAVYWLIRAAGDVLVVPAKYLAAAGSGTARPSSKQFTVGCTAVRHTTVPMEQYLPDLMVVCGSEAAATSGGWLLPPGEEPTPSEGRLADGTHPAGGTSCRSLDGTWPGRSGSVRILLVERRPAPGSQLDRFVPASETWQQRPSPAAD
ncbi:hypothetical protein [Streptomyces sp. NPDC006368]|uniref:hypothetical protein n=1 Tax=Streptomyces sp. NPDC006368 TaxID=3156760 RepID=UPI0033AAEC8D